MSGVRLKYQLARLAFVLCRKSEDDLSHDRALLNRTEEKAINRVKRREGNYKPRKKENLVLMVT